MGHRKKYTLFRTKNLKGVFFMKGYVVENGYMGYVDGKYMLFADEADYREYMMEE